MLRFLDCSFFRDKIGRITLVYIIVEFPRSLMDVRSVIYTMLSSS